MEIKNRLTAVYNEVILPLANHSSPTNTILGMTAYMTVFGEVMLSFADKMNAEGASLLAKFPDKDPEIRQCVQDPHNKLISTYKPK